jgi:antitoxin (DNA-binding transcriptional repressor) of toxin-antitoxin stability system
MKAVGIKVLKARLGEYLCEVKAGETVLVTERDEVIAELRPARRQAIQPGDLDEVLERLSARGEVRLRSATRPANWAAIRPDVHFAGVRSEDILDDLRSEDDDR